MRVVSLLLLMTCGHAWAGPDHYTVRIEANRRLVAHVEAHLESVGSGLSMSDYGAWSQAEGWATFVSSLEVVGADGRVVPVEKKSKLEWETRELGPSEGVRLSYRVDLSHAQAAEWPDGPRTTGALWKDDGLSMLAAMLFVRPSTDRRVTVEFDLPPGWKASTPWPSRDGRLFDVPDMQSLVHNVLVLGRHAHRELFVGESRITLAAVGLAEDALQQIEPVVRTTLRDYQVIFERGIPRHYLMVWIADPTWDTGEAYDDSYIVATTREITNRSKPNWATTIAHELFHIWLGHRISMEPWSETQWFSEGVTEYMANSSLARTGLIDERQALHLFQNHALLFLRFRYRWGTPYEALSLVAAGENKSQYNVAIYDGGWVAAFCLDVLMREASDNHVGLPQLMRQIDARFGESERKLTNQVVVEIAEALSGARIGEFVDRHVDGVEMIPLQDFFERAGFDAVAHSRDVDLLLDPRATKLRTQIRKAIIGY